MNHSEKPIEDLLFALKERAKELNCLYEIEELFSRPDATLPKILEGMVQAIPPGWQYPDVCQVKIATGDLILQSQNWKETPWKLSADVVVQEQIVGNITVSYTEEMPTADEGPFLKEERKLIETIADRLERRILHERMKTVFEDQKSAVDQRSQSAVIIDLLKKTDAKLLTRIARKMLNFLSWSGIQEADRLVANLPTFVEESTHNENRPLAQRTTSDLQAMSDEIFQIANRYLGEKQVLVTIQEWMIEDRSNFMIKVLEDPGTSLAEIINAIERFQHRAPQSMDLSPPRERALRVSLIRRLLNDDPLFIQTAKRFLDVSDFHELYRHIIFPAGSHGKVGGKGSGLFLAKRILQTSLQSNDELRKIKTPRTWYLTSDAILRFINHNDLEEMMEQKYEDIAQVRQEYPYIVHVFKNSQLPPEIMNGLSVALDDFGESPLVIRSSSILEDRFGSSFAGKYKSLFIANQGTKNERLHALVDAITEVYASTFSPDAIEYRAEHGMIDSHEEMGILIQEVVGNRIGYYFLPAFAGVSFSSNDFRWSPRIRKEDGLLRIVPGLGTRAVDRLSDDYSILLSPGQPELSVNVTREEKIWYSPKKVDVINLETNSFETIEIRELFKSFGEQYPMISKIVSLVDRQGLRRPGGLDIDFKKNHLVVTFEGLFRDTNFLVQLQSMMRVFQSEMNGPVDVEFAHDGTDLYLLQCRYQSSSSESLPAVVPRAITGEKLLFSANRYVTNGKVSGVTFIVYVDPVAYGELKTQSDLLAVGRVIGKLNQMLPKRKFILMGPGRWGSRGDIKLGVNVTYSDIKNTSMLIEIARKREGYMPELSFGTHFFQDLVESSIRYLPLYPDDKGVVFNEQFFLTSPNVLSKLLPEFANLQQIIRVIDIDQTMPGNTLQILMNGDRDEAVAVLTENPVEEEEHPQSATVLENTRETRQDSHWRWRLKRIEQLAAHLDPVRFGVKAMYVFGSTMSATSGPKSDIDLLVHFHGNDIQEKELMAWLEGWSLCLSEENYLRTGHKTSSLLDVHLITDKDIRSRSSFASRIGSISDPPLPLSLGKNVKKM